MVAAWRLLLACAPQLQLRETFRYDLVDVGRQVLSKHATSLWQRAVQAYEDGNAGQLLQHGQALLELMDAMDELLSSNRSLPRQWNVAGLTAEAFQQVIQQLICS